MKFRSRRNLRLFFFSRAFGGYGLIRIKGNDCDSGAFGIQNYSIKSKYINVYTQTHINTLISIHKDIYVSSSWGKETYSKRTVQGVGGNGLIRKEKEKQKEEKKENPFCDMRAWRGD